MILVHLSCVSWVATTISNLSSDIQYNIKFYKKDVAILKSRDISQSKWFACISNTI
jgi:hypothetical protein